MATKVGKDGALMRGTVGCVGVVWIIVVFCKDDVGRVRCLLRPVWLLTEECCGELETGECSGLDWWHHEWRTKLVKAEFQRRTAKGDGVNTAPGPRLGHTLCTISTRTASTSQFIVCNYVPLLVNLLYLHLECFVVYKLIPCLGVFFVLQNPLGK